METTIHSILNSIKSELIKNNGFNNSNIGLMGGDISQILFHFYFNKYYNLSSTQEIETILVNNYSNISDKFHGMTLSSGLSGLSFVTNFLIENDIIDKNDVDIEMIDIEITSFATTELSKSNFDYLHGGLGGIMNLNEYDTNNVDVFIEKIHMNRVEICKNEFTMYNTSINDIASKVSNLGLAHGLPSIVIVLSKLFGKTNKKEMCFELISNLLSFIKKHKKTNEFSLFPDSVDGHNKIDKSGRLAWCYGDLGIASAFWQAGKVFNNKSWNDEAIDILIFNSKKRDLKLCGIKDACFCHGTSGVAHIFNRFYLETNISEFENASRFWLNETLKKSEWKEGSVQFKNWKNSDIGFQNDLGLLEGTTGVGLVLLGFLLNKKEDLNWDKCFLLS